MDQTLPWFEVLEPDETVLQERLDESMFAADLHEVVRRKAARDYREPQRFFERTHPTKGMVQLLSDVLKRLAAREAVNSVIQIQTPFGGGKTHALIALYHLFKHQESHYTTMGEAVRQAAEVNAIPPAQVAAFVGTVPDPLKAKTPWGMIAEQLGRYDRVRDHDKQRIAPGREVLQEMLSNGATLVLMDELAEFIAKAPTDYDTQILAFCHELTEAVRGLPGCSLVVTLPASAPYGDRGERALRQLEQIFGRMQAFYAPVEGLEIYEIVRRRLFQFPDGWERDAAQVVDEYMNAYRRWSDAPEWAREESYRDRMLSAYPFHPMLIDWLHERWGSYDTFQRTRGVLRFLAWVVRDAWDMRDRMPSPLIHPTQVNLRRAELAEELLRHIGREYEAILQADVRERAEPIDRVMGDWERYRIASGLTTAVFSSSFTATAQGRKGASLPELKVATWQPGIEPAVISDTLKRLEGSLLYLHQRDGLYVLSLELNLTRARLDQEHLITEDELSKEMDRRVRELVKDRGVWQVRFAPAASRDVPDTRDLQLVVLSPTQPRRTAEGLAKDIVEKRGDIPRVYRNAVVVVLADDEALWQGQQTIRSYLALQHISKSDLMQQLSQSDRRRLNDELRGYDADIPRRLCEAYRYLVKVTDRGVQWMDMGTLTEGESAQIVPRAEAFLRREDLLMNERVNPEQVKELMGDQAEKPLREVWEEYGKFPRLPMLRSKDVLAETVRRGVRERLVAVRVLRRVYYGSPTPGDSDWVDDAVLLREPIAVEEAEGGVGITDVAGRPGPVLTVDDIVQAMAGTEEQTLSALYQHLWRERRASFPSEAVFRDSFKAALQAGQDEGRWQVAVGDTPFIREDLDLDDALRRGLLKLSKKPPVLPKRPVPLALRLTIPRDRLGAFAQTVVSLTRLGMLSETVEVYLQTTDLDEGKRRQLRSIITETMAQLGGKTIEPTDWGA